MDGTQFDDLTRRLATGISRRSVFTSLLGGLAGALAGRAGADATQRRPRQANGASCSRATDCESFLCADGVCCDTACTGQCETCALGSCTPVTGAPPSGKPPCPGDGPCAATCDGQTTAACAGLPGSETGCGATTCANGWQTTYACGGNGTCVPTSTRCAPYGCNATGTACATGCTGDEECGPGSHCDDGLCFADEGLGRPCDEDSDCQSGVCVNNICCAERCGACQVCAANGYCGPAPDTGECDGGVCCEGSCVDTDTDPEHCGGCATACPDVPNAFVTCEGGTCVFGCQPGYRRCGGACIPETACCTVDDCLPRPASILDCINNECVVTGCGWGIHFDCIDVFGNPMQCRSMRSAELCDGECVDTSYDPQHCGGCGKAVDTDRGEGCCDGQVCTVDTMCVGFGQPLDLHVTGTITTICGAYDE